MTFVSVQSKCFMHKKKPETEKFIQNSLKINENVLIIDDYFAK